MRWLIFNLPPKDLAHGANSQNAPPAPILPRSDLRVMRHYYAVVLHHYYAVVLEEFCIIIIYYAVVLGELCSIIPSMTWSYATAQNGELQ